MLDGHIDIQTYIHTDGQTHKVIFRCCFVPNKSNVILIQVDVPPFFLEIMTDRPTDATMDMRGHREVALLITSPGFDQVFAP